VENCVNTTNHFLHSLWKTRWKPVFSRLLLWKTLWKLWKCRWISRIVYTNERMNKIVYDSVHIQFRIAVAQSAGFWYTIVYKQNCVFGG